MDSRKRFRQIKSVALLLLTSSQILSGCATTPSKLSETGKGHFKAKALVRDLSSGKSQVVNLDLKSIDLENFRLDVTSSLGLHVFSLVARSNQIEYLVVSEKKHYKATASPKALAPIFSTPIDPKWLAYLFFNKSIPDKRWSCTLAKDDRARQCRDLGNKLTVSWETSKDASGLIRIEAPGQSVVQISVREYSNELKDAASILALKVPKSFTTISL